MGDLINLNKARKERTKTDKTKAAAENRVGFGQTKAAKLTLKDRLEKACKQLDQMRLEPPPK
jgi:hypothetical protein